MKVVQAPYPALGFDGVTTIDAVSAPGLRATGLKFGIRYLGSVTVAELVAMTAAGLLCSFVTFADVYNGAEAREQLNSLGVPAGATVWLDVESVAPGITSTALSALITAWAQEILAGGWEPGLYVGANAKLTSAELYALPVVRYWKGMSRIEDRFGNLAEPTCGWSLVQQQHTVILASVSVDVDSVCYDYQGRLPVFVTA